MKLGRSICSRYGNNSGDVLPVRVRALRIGEIEFLRFDAIYAFSGFDLVKPANFSGTSGNANAYSAPFRRAII